MSIATPPIAVIPEEPQLRTETSAIVTSAQSIVVSDDASYSAAGEFLRKVATLKKKVMEVIGPVVTKAHEAHKAAVKMRDELLAPPATAEDLVKRKMATWENEQQRLREAEQRRLQAIADKEAEDRRLAEALEAEERAKALAAQNRPEEAAQAEQQVQELLEAPISAPPIQLPPATPKVQGVSMRETWSAQVDSMMDLVRAIAAGKASIEFVAPNLPALNAQARSLKETFNIPGVRAIKVSSPSVRAF